MKQPPIQVSALALEYSRRLAEAGDQIAEELGCNGGDFVQGAAIFAGVTAKCNARPGNEPVVAAISASIVERMCLGGRTLQ